MILAVADTNNKFPAGQNRGNPIVIGSFRLAEHYSPGDIFSAKEDKLGLVMLVGPYSWHCWGITTCCCPQTLVRSITSYETIRLVLVIIGITSLGYLLKATGIMDEML